MVSSAWPHKALIGTLGWARILTGLSGLAGSGAPCTRPSKAASAVELLLERWVTEASSPCPGPADGVAGVGVEGAAGLGSAASVEVLAGAGLAGTAGSWLLTREVLRPKDSRVALAALLSTACTGTCEACLMIHVLQIHTLACSMTQLPAEAAASPPALSIWQGCAADRSC